MKNLWNNSKSLKYIQYYKRYNVSKDLALRIYTTHLLGVEKKLVGFTSCWWLILETYKLSSTLA